MQRIAAFLLSFTAPFTLSATPAELLQQDVDAIFSKITTASSPGCNVGISHNGKYLVKKGYGLANLELNAPLDGNQVHRMASVSKQFTAMAVLLLADEGKIELDKDIRHYLPELKDYQHSVTINAMLGHFAGMADYEYIADPEQEHEGGANLKSVAGGTFRIGNEDYLTIDEFYNVVKTIDLKRKPDTRWEYSNIAYFLLSMLVEKVSGETLREYAHRRIFEPLAMTSTFFSDSPAEIVKHRADGYGISDDGRYINSMTNLFWVGDGGLHTNLDDMLKWERHFSNPVLGEDPNALMAKFNTPNSQHEPSENYLYANGQFVNQTPRGMKYSHSGGWLGTSTYFLRMPEQRFAVMLMCNLETTNTRNIVTQITESYLKHFSFKKVD